MICIRFICNVTFSNCLISENVYILYFICIPLSPSSSNETACWLAPTYSGKVANLGALPAFSLPGWATQAVLTRITMSTFKALTFLFVPRNIVQNVLWDAWWSSKILEASRHILFIHFISVLVLCCNSALLLLKLNWHATPIVKLHNHRFYSSALIETTPPNLVVLKVFYYSLLCLVTFLNTAKLHDVDTSLVTADLSLSVEFYLTLLYIEKFQNCTQRQSKYISKKSS